MCCGGRLVLDQWVGGREGFPEMGERGRLLITFN